jgi:hypothetical protein
MRYPSRIAATFKVLSTSFIVLIVLFLCSCEKDSVSTDSGLGDWHFDGIYIGPTWGSQSIAGTPNFNKVVLCHEYKDCIYYLVGTVDQDNYVVNWGGNNEWSASMHLGDGAISPQASVSDNGVVICAFQTCYYNGEPAGKVYVGVGTINGDSINWGSFTYAGISGYYPSVAITRDGKYAVLVFQESQNGGVIYYATTTINPNSNSLNWSAYNQFAMGYRPSIAMNNYDQLVAVFNSWGDSDGLWCTVNQFYRNSGTIAGLGECSFGGTSKTSYARPIVTMGDSDGECSVYALATLSDVPTIEYFYAGNLAQNGNMTWGGSVAIDQWITSASLTNGFNNNVIEVYEDGNNANKMYYFFYTK